jgi:hypothetical protein
MSHTSATKPVRFHTNYVKSLFTRKPTCSQAAEGIGVSVPGLIPAEEALDISFGTETAKAPLAVASDLHCHLSHFSLKREHPEKTKHFKIQGKSQF